MTAQKTDWKCPWCDVAFSGEDIELHTRSEVKDAMKLAGWNTLLRETAELPEILCKVCDNVALHEVYVTAECAHEQENPSALCEQHKAQAMHPSYRMSCSTCLDTTGVHSEVWVSHAKRIYLAAPEGN